MPVWSSVASLFCLGANPLGRLKHVAHLLGAAGHGEALVEQGPGSPSPPDPWTQRPALLERPALCPPHSKGPPPSRILWHESAGSPLLSAVRQRLARPPSRAQVSLHHWQRAQRHAAQLRVVVTLAIGAHQNHGLSARQHLLVEIGRVEATFSSDQFRNWPSSGIPCSVRGLKPLRRLLVGSIPRGQGSGDVSGRAAKRPFQRQAPAAPLKLTAGFAHRTRLAV